MEDRNKRINSLAADVLTTSRNQLLVNFRFLDLALSMFDYRIYTGTAATDGKTFYYNPVHILKSFKAEKEYCSREYLHMVFHCVFHHMFVGKFVDKGIWNLACDIAVENAIAEVSIKSLEVMKETEEIKILTLLKKEIGILTAEKICRYFTYNGFGRFEQEELEYLFTYDDHSVWYEKPESFAFDISDEMDKGNNGQPVKSNSAVNSSKTAQSNINGSKMDFIPCDMMVLQSWKDISERMQQDLEVFTKEQGNAAGSTVMNLKEINREKYDYTSFLKKFAVTTEVMKINDDEFDYIFYTYGLNLFKKMPLIEPLEYKDGKRIKEFVIAIDTSGSTSSSLVHKFITKTYNILKTAETFDTRINLHIIQCDAIIQEDKKITNQLEFDEYLKGMKILGCGGTDFRPVFKYIEELQEQKELTNLKGLIYFTDGMGTYPAKKPPYDTAFIFMQSNYYDVAVPPWAIKLILNDEDL